MTVLSDTSKVRRAGNGVATSFSFPFTIYESTDLVVVKIDDEGVETTLSEGTGTSNYAVVVSSYPGAGSVTFPASGSTYLATGEYLTIKRVLDLTQETDLENQGGYFPDVQERVYDRLTMIAQQQEESLGRSFKASEGDDGTVDYTVAQPTAGYYLRVNAAGDGLEWAALASTTASASDEAPEDISLSGPGAGTAPDYAREDHVHELPVVSIAKGGTGQATAALAFAALKQAATDEATGAVELATTAEVTAGTDTARAVTPAGLAGRNPEEVAVVATDMVMIRQTSTGLEKTDSARDVANLAQGRWVVLDTETASGAASVSLTGFDNALYSDYRVILDNVAPSTDAQALLVRTSTDAGANYDSGSSDYVWSALYIVFGVGVNGSSDDADTDIELTAGLTVGNSTDENVSGIVNIINPGAAQRCVMQWVIDFRNAAGGYGHITGSGRRAAAADVTGIQFRFASGNISGGFRLEGLKR